MDSKARTKGYENKLKAAINKDRYQSEEGDIFEREHEEVKYKDSNIQANIDEELNNLSNKYPDVTTISAKEAKQLDEEDKRLLLESIEKSNAKLREQIDLITNVYFKNFMDKVKPSER